MLGETRGGGPVWDVESGGTVCVLVADCQRPQSRARPRTTFLTIRPQYESVPVPVQNLQPLTTPRMKHEPMPTQRVLTNHRSHALRQPVEPAAHVHGLTRQPDPRFLRAVHRLQTRQPDHDAVSTTASNARTCSASNPRPTSRLRPFCNRISTRESPAAFGADSVSCTSRNFTAVSLRNRFFHAKKYGLHRPCSRQNAVTVCPLRACSEISLRHFVRAFFPRLVMSLALRHDLLQDGVHLTLTKHLCLCCLSEGRGRANPRPQRLTCNMSCMTLT